jgi:hypothetical protein
MRIMVTGSRKWTDGQAIRMALLPYFLLGEDITLVTGGAEGADTLAEEMAKGVIHQLVLQMGGTMRVTVEKFRPRYIKGDMAGNKFAPLQRNLDMLDTKPDVVLAFKLGYGTNGGTQFTIANAQRRGIPVVIYNLPEPEEAHDESHAPDEVH